MAEQNNNQPTSKNRFILLGLGLLLLFIGIPGLKGLSGMATGSEGTGCGGEVDSTDLALIEEADKDEINGIYCETNDDKTLSTCLLPLSGVGPVFQVDLDIPDNTTLAGITCPDATGVNTCSSDPLKLSSGHILLSKAIGQSVSVFAYSVTNAPIPEGQNLELTLKPKDIDNFGADTSLTLEGSILTATSDDGTLKQVGIAHNSNALTVETGRPTDTSSNIVDNYSFSSQSGADCWRHSNTTNNTEAFAFDLSTIWQLINQVNDTAVGDIAPCMDLAEPVDRLTPDDIKSAVNVVFWNKNPNGSDAQKMGAYIDAWVKDPDTAGPPEMVMTKIKEYFPNCTDKMPCAEIVSLLDASGLAGLAGQAKPDLGLPELNKEPPAPDKDDMLQ